MNDIDLNIENYNFDELLNIFKIDDSYENPKNKKKMNTVLSAIKQTVPNLYPFYFKCQKVISIIYKILEDQSLPQNQSVDSTVQKIVKVENFENYEDSDLIERIVKKSVETYNKSRNDYSLLNDPNYNVHKYMPGLNNKNVTNLITNSFPNAVAPGELNPVKRITQNQNLNLNSCFRHNYFQSNPCDFLYMIPVEIKNVLSIRLVSIEIPNAWYLFSHMQKNNLFQVEVKVNKKSYFYDIVIPDGNYDIDTLQHFLNTTYFYESSLDTYLKYIRFSIDSYSYRTRFEVVEERDDALDDFHFSLKFVDNINQNRMNTCGWILGFRLANYLDIEEKIQSEGLFDGGGDRYIYVAINDFQYNNNTLNTVCFDKSILNEDIIAKIPMMNGKLSLVVSDDHNPLAKIRRYTGPVNISKLHIKILDKFGTVIDLNNMDFSLTFELELLYESFNFKNVSY